MTREDVILQVYRSLRDTFNSLDNVKRDGNTVIIEKGKSRARISFRIRVEVIEETGEPPPF